MKRNSLHHTWGSISIIILVFGLTVSVIIGGLVLIAATQYTSSTRTEVFEKSLTIAQAGAEYYLWHLNHNPTDYMDGTGHSGPYIHTISDPYGQTESTYSLNITPPASGSSILTITSKGWVNSHPEIVRTIKAQVGIASVAKYAFLHNANLWFGQKTTIHGKVFSNGGIRMDGTHDSTVQSAKQTYTCGSESGCDPPETKPGIWGDGGPKELWEFPVTTVDFNSIAMDFSASRTSAQQKGLYLSPSGAYGYHITFASDGTYTVSTVTGAKNIKGWSIEYGCENLYQEITKETTLGSYSITTKAIIFAEDNLWIEGVIRGKVTVVAAKFPLNVNYMNIFVNNNITYAAKDGTNSLGAIAQNNIVIPLNCPEILEMDGAFLAQSGKVIRHDYKEKDCNHEPHAVKQRLLVYGSIISNQRSYWNYGGGSAGYGSDPLSGFSHVEITYDPNLYFTPPPYFPSQGGFEFISWQEQ